MNKRPYNQGAGANQCALTHIDWPDLAARQLRLAGCTIPSTPDTRAVLSLAGIAGTVAGRPGSTSQLTWLTPARTPCVPCCPQLPVASEYFRPLVMVPVFTANGRLISLPVSTAFCSWALMSLHSLLHADTVAVLYLSPMLCRACTSCKWCSSCKRRPVSAALNQLVLLDSRCYACSTY